MVFMTQLTPITSIKTLLLQPDELFPLCSMRDKYDGEKTTILGTVEGWGEIHQHCKVKKEKNVYILYLSAQRAAHYEVSYNTSLGRWERDDKALSEGSYSFVINSNWKMLACSDADQDLFNTAIKGQKLGFKVLFKHSSLTSGKEVFFGGSCTLEKGRFTWDEQSGHYRPKAIHVASCMAWQKSHGVKDALYIKYVKEKSDGKNNKPDSLKTPIS
jgi:hypothetical protein